MEYQPRTTSMEAISRTLSEVYQTNTNGKMKKLKCEEPFKRLIDSNTSSILFLTDEAK